MYMPISSSRTLNSLIKTRSLFSLIIKLCGHGDCHPWQAACGEVMLRVSWAHSGCLSLEVSHRGRQVYLPRPPTLNKSPCPNPWNLLSI